MSQQTIGDYVDLLNISYSSAGGRATALMRRAVELAIERLPSLYSWNFLSVTEQCVIEQPVVLSNQDVTYHDEGLLEISPGPFPAWAGDAAVVVSGGGVTYTVDGVHLADANRLVVARTNSGMSLTGANVSVYGNRLKLSYPLHKVVMVIDGDTHQPLRHNDQPQIESFRLAPADAGSPASYSVRTVGDRQRAVFIYPPSVGRKTLIVRYQRAHSEIRHDMPYSAGTVAVNGSVATFSGANVSSMAGMMLRVGSGSEVPTGRHGQRPYASQAVIVKALSVTEALLDRSLGTVPSGTRYLIDQPVEYDDTVVGNLMQRLCEAELETMVGSKSAEQSSVQRADFMVSLRDAISADNSRTGHDWSRLATIRPFV